VSAASLKVTLTAAWPPCSVIGESGARPGRRRSRRANGTPSTRAPRGGEREVAELAAEGLTGRDIAARLGIGQGTVRNHLQHARDKLGGLAERDFTRFK